jgi:hypothetical protein
MKKYLREIELAGVILMAIGVAIAVTIGYNYGMWPCAVGLLLLLSIFLYKAFHWKEYERENKQYIIMMIICIIILILQMVI